uniref:Apple domain-containing protein n=1 Tax=Chromera velia CCMP2878 TaxID=1169474 RepID=A0A0G4FYS2_9ALVE|eukprot:Cvel_19315.t1-p1 / transcript=Cvel_19315.t1 / gene=Cvel_19315 / organism=Chromera_velia_CCMP2878 / gene_product=hypothetical protein / transcript_product=hypothetical protein / location=Cvel_scaffold1655:33038-38900(+) / protein_length=556 / sequence_SO=supercontig / SO=protein_coding / is_pseudo=false
MLLSNTVAHVYVCLLALLFLGGSEGRKDSFCLEIGWEPKGSSFRIVDGFTDPRDCQQECQYTDGCNFFRWRGRGRFCEMFSHLYGEWERDVASVSGPKTCFAAFSDFPEIANSACQVTGLEIQGSQYESYTGRNSRHCRDSCNKDPRCRYWSWKAPSGLKPPHQRCRLFTSVAAITVENGFAPVMGGDLDPSIRAVSGPKKCPSDVPQFKIWRSKKVGDYDRILPWPKEPVNGRRHLPFCVEHGVKADATPQAAFRVGDPRDCSSLCSALPGCASWTWFPFGEENAERCELFKETPQKVPFPGAKSGPSVCEDPPTDFPEYSQMACSTWGVRTIGQVLSSAPMEEDEVPDDCLILCQDTEGCVAYTHDAEAHVCTLFSTDEGIVGSIGSVAGPAVCQDRPSHHRIWKAITRTEGFADDLQALPLEVAYVYDSEDEDLEGGDTPFSYSRVGGIEEVEEAEPEFESDEGDYYSVIALSANETEGSESLEEWEETEETADAESGQGDTDADAESVRRLSVNLFDRRGGGEKLGEIGGGSSGSSASWTFGGTGIGFEIFD